MQIIPAIDLKDNKCVRLSRGEDDTSIVFNKDPQKQAAYFEEKGCKKLHIVDLDAAFGKPELNLLSIKKIRETVSIPIQLGGGIRNKSDVKRYFDLGIDNLIVGSMSVNQPEELIQLTNVYNNRIYVSLDIKNNNIMIKGWREKSKLTLTEILNLYKDTQVKGYIITDINNDGMLEGLNINFIKETISQIINTNKSNKNIIIAGGLTNYEDLHKLKNLGINNIEGIISGKSFYVGNIDLEKAQKILN